MRDKRKRNPPESDFLDTLKRQRVHLRMTDGKHIAGVLQWVDTYSYGIEVEEQDCDVVMVSKHSVAIIGPAREH